MSHWIRKQPGFTEACLFVIQTDDPYEIAEAITRDKLQIKEMEDKIQALLDLIGD